MNLKREGLDQWKVGIVRDRLEKINRRAEKLGVRPLSLSVVEHPLTDEISGRVTITADVAVTGEVPALPGWELLAVVSTLEGGVIVRTLPGVEGDFSSFRADAATCDHCETVRRRTDTFLVRHVSGGIKRVGRDCLKDFTGHDPAGVLFFAELADSLFDEDFGFGGGGDEAFDLRVFLAHAAAVINDFGFVSNAKVRDNPSLRSSSDAAVDRLTNPRQSRPLTDRDAKLAEETLEYLKRLSERPEAGLSDFDRNLVAVFKTGYVQRRTFGLAAAAVNSLQHEKAKAAELAGIKDEHFGTVGKRETFTLALKAVRHYESLYGPGVVLKFADPEGREAVWFTGHGLDFDVGKTYTVKATVKSHGDRNGRKQTILSRAKVL